MKEVGKGRAWRGVVSLSRRGALVEAKVAVQSLSEGWGLCLNESLIDARKGPGVFKANLCKPDLRNPTETAIIHTYMNIQF